MSNCLKAGQSQKYREPLKMHISKEETSEKSSNVNLKISLENTRLNKGTHTHTYRHRHICLFGYVLFIIGSKTSTMLKLPTVLQLSENFRTS